MNKVSKVVTIMGVAVMLLGFNATAGSLLGGDRYDKDGNCFKSGVLGNVPCKTAVPAPIPPATNCDISKAPCGKEDSKAKNLIGLSKTFTPSPALFKTDTKAELQKETSLKIKGWASVYQVNVIQKTSGFGCMVIRKAVGITEITIHSNQNCRKSPIEK
jgi:hypothetical protein